MSLIECIDLTIFCNFAQSTLAYKKLFICSNFDEIFLSNVCNGRSSSKADKERCLFGIVSSLLWLHQQLLY